MNENELTKAKLSELSLRAYERGYTVYSDFLNMNEISLLKALKTASPYTLYGGYEAAERCVAAFGEADGLSAFPIVCLQIEPLQQKFADKMSHRDVLGALMNLGINRSTLGDIYLHNNTAFLFCLSTIAPYIEQNLTRIRHTTVSCQTAEAVPAVLSQLPPLTEVITASVRADAVIGAVYRLSRAMASRLFTSEKVFINGVITAKEGQQLKENDIVSVRGYGRFIFEGTVRNTKKNRCIVSVRIYR